MCISKDLPSWQELEAMFVADFENGKLYRRETGRELVARNGWGYVCVKIEGKAQYRHRVLMKMYNKDEFIEDCNINHINEVKGDDRIENLEMTTARGNKSASALNKNGRVGYYEVKPGVYRAMCSATAKGIKQFLAGDYRSEDNAAKAYAIAVAYVDNCVSRDDFNLSEIRRLLREHIVEPGVRDGFRRCTLDADRYHLRNLVAKGNVYKVLFKRGETSRMWKFCSLDEAMAKRDEVEQQILEGVSLSDIQ